MKCKLSIQKKGTGTEMSGFQTCQDFFFLETMCIESFSKVVFFFFQVICTVKVNSSAFDPNIKELNIS